MAPEVLCGSQYGHSADWWSLGVSTYRLAHGKQPFARGRDHKETAELQTLKGLSLEHQDPLAHDLTYACFDPEPASREAAVLAVLAKVTASAAAAGPVNFLQAHEEASATSHQGNGTGGEA